MVNAPALEALPAAAVRARGNLDARQLAAARWLVRRKSDGRYLATIGHAGQLQPLHADAWQPHAGLAELLERIDAAPAPGILPMTGLQSTLRQLDIPPDYGPSHALELVGEPLQLHFGGFDRYRRALWLEAGTVSAWTRMRAAARADGERLDAISGYRSHAYQLGIFRRKRARGLSVEQILAVNAAPGYSEHHSGRALDISCPGQPAAEASFEHTDAFAWLRSNAARFGFRLSYPRDNPHGIAYEPWHWYHSR